MADRIASFYLKTISFTEKTASSRCSSSSFLCLLPPPDPLAAVNVVISGLRVIHDFGSVRHASELTDLLNTHASGEFIAATAHQPRSALRLAYFDSV